MPCSSVLHLGLSTVQGTGGDRENRGEVGSREWCPTCPLRVMKTTGDESGSGDIQFVTVGDKPRRKVGQIRSQCGRSGV